MKTILNYNLNSSFFFISYQLVMSMAIVALISLLGEPGRIVESLRLSTNMEIMEQAHSPRILLFKKKGEMLINSCGEATLLISRAQSITNADKPKITACLWSNLLKHVHAVQSSECFELVLDNISALIVNVSILYYFI